MLILLLQDPFLRHVIILKESAKVARSLVVFSFPDQLSCDNHRFLEGLHLLSESLEVFYNSVMSSEVDIFERCKITWSPFKKTSLIKLLQAASKL